MCGLALVLGDAPDEVVYAAARWAGQRGPHEHGIATWTPDGWDVHRASGPLTALPDSGSVVAHSRLATCGASPGDAPEVAEAQPYTTGRYLIAHNGTIPDHVVRRYIDPPPDVDSMALLLALEAGVEPPAVLGETPAAAAVIWSDGLGYYAYRQPGDRTQAHPLYVSAGDGWTVVTSGPIMGGRLLPERQTVVLG